MKIRFKIRSSKKIKSFGLKERRSSSYKYLIYFFAFVIFCIVFAIGVRIVLLVKDSSFNANSYSLLVRSTHPFILLLNKQSGTLYTIFIKPENNTLKTSIDYAIPIDGVVENVGDVSPNQFLSFKTLLFQFLKSKKKSYENMNSIDAIRFITSSFSVSPEQKKEYTISLSKKGEVLGVSGANIFEIVKDLDMVNEAVSIEVVNETFVDGLAGKVAILIENIGGNVVSVTSENSTETSKIIVNNSSSTAKRISHILQIPIINKKTSSVADVKIILGEDFVKKMR